MPVFIQGLFVFVFFVFYIKIPEAIFFEGCLFSSLYIQSGSEHNHALYIDSAGKNDLGFAHGHITMTRIY